MGKKTKKKPADETPEPLEGEAVEAPEAPQVERTPLEQAEFERDEHFANLLRAQADNQNLRRRMQETIDATVRSTEGGMLRELLQAVEWLDMALLMEVESHDARNLKVGVQMTRDQLWNSMQRFQIAAVDTDGAFDPRLHQAVAAVETEEHEAGTILEVVRPGWMRGEEVLRHAHVKVAAAPSAEGEGDPDAEGSEEASAEDAT